MKLKYLILFLFNIVFSTIFAQSKTAPDELARGKKNLQRLYTIDDDLKQKMTKQELDDCVPMTNFIKVIKIDEAKLQNMWDILSKPLNTHGDVLLAQASDLASIIKNSFYYIVPFFNQGKVVTAMSIRKEKKGGFFKKKTEWLVMEQYNFNMQKELNELYAIEKFDKNTTEIICFKTTKKDISFYYINNQNSKRFYTNFFTDLTSIENLSFELLKDKIAASR